MERTWSNYQQAIFSFVATGTGNAIVEAVAGSGKTTTIVEALRRVRGSSVFLAFNKSIAEELKARGVNARTFHSLTYGPVTRHRKARNVEPNKLRLLCDDRLTGEDARLYGSFVTRLVSIGRQQGIGALVEDTPQAWAELAEHHDIELEHDAASYSTALGLASKLLQWSNESQWVDFDDLLYLAVRDGVALPKFDFVFVDEAQDTNAIQRAILRKIMHAGTRLVAVGDPAQAIYGFRGADSDALDLIASEFDAVRLPLTVSYRCPQAVVRYAQQWVQHIQPAPTAPEGTVRDVGTQWKPEDLQAGDLVVCRTTRPLVSVAYACLRARVPARIMGKDIGQGLVALVNKMRAKGVDHLVAKLGEYTEREVEKAVAKKQEAKAEALRDKCDTVLFLVDTLPETDRTVPALLRVIDSLFSGAPGAGVTLATIHKAKGLEAERVYWLNRNACPSKWARQPWQQQQERNLCYVATTRAKAELVLIEEGVRA